jgi:hypothetical protein
MRPLREALRAHLPPVAVATVTLLHAQLIHRESLRQTGGSLSFPVDDAFIHLALARNLALDGVYGVSPHEFTAASSSIGWPLLLAFAIKVFGPHAELALWLNFAIAVLLCFVVDRAAQKLSPGISWPARIVVGLFATALAPLPTLLLVGMEHTAHATATLGLLAAAATWLGSRDADPHPTGRAVRSLALWALLTTLWRYEGMFLVFLIALLAFLRGRRAAAGVIAAGGAVPIVAFGLYAKAQGGLFFPTPVLLKGSHVDLGDIASLGELLGGKLADNLAEGHVLAAVVAAAVLAYHAASREGLWSPRSVALSLVLGTLALHLELANLGWWYRYETYLLVAVVALSGTYLAHALPSPAATWKLAREEPGRAIAAAALLLSLVTPLARRAVEANILTPTACRNIYEQQVQSARFLAEAFPDERVAVNDIGAVVWGGSERVVDLVGLATLEIAKAKGLKLDEKPSAADIVRLTEGVKVAIVYERWFRGVLPPSWVRVGRWHIEKNRSCAFPVVGIYAASTDDYPRVIAALREFSKKLPGTVREEGRYTDRDLAGAPRVRVGDRIVFKVSGLPELSGSYEVEPEGLLRIAKVGPVLVRGATEEEARAALEARVAQVREGERLGPAAVEHFAWVRGRVPRVHVAGRVLESTVIERASLTIDEAIAAAGPTPEANVGAAYVWREEGDSFVRLARDELGGEPLADGDLVVVP